MSGGKLSFLPLNVASDGSLTSSSGIGSKAFTMDVVI
jgi:hypothetical protein